MMNADFRRYLEEAIAQDLLIEVGLAHIEVALLPDVIHMHERVDIRETLLHRCYQLLCHTSNSLLPPLLRPRQRL